MLRFRFGTRRKLTIPDVLVVAKQCLYQVKNFSAFHTLPVRRLEMHEELGGHSRDS